MGSSWTCPSRLLVVLLLASLAASCDATQDPIPEVRQPAADAADAATTGASSAPMPSDGAPDPAAARERLLANLNMVTPDVARIVSYQETAVRYEGPPEMRTAIVSYEAELEFTADTYFHTGHRAGDRAQVYGEIENINEGGSWRLLTMGIYPR